MPPATEISWDELKKMIFSLAEQSKETDRRMQETDRLIRELRESSKATEASIKALRQEMGRLGNRLGEFVEGFVVN